MSSDSRPRHIQRLHLAFSKWLSLANYNTVDVICAAYLANQLDGVRLWLCLIGPASCGKTTMAETLLGLTRTQRLDGISRGTFTSGYRLKSSKERFGLLDKMDDGKPHMLIVPDFSTFLQKDPKERGEVMAQLRCIYDGALTRPYGTGVDYDWKGKIGMIACATPNSERIISNDNAFGERFLYWKMQALDPEAAAEKALRNSEQKEEMKQELQTAVKEAIAKCKLRKNLRIKLAVRNVLKREVTFIARARTPVERDWNGTGDIIERPSIESPTRLAQQLGQLLKGLLTLYDLDDMDEMTLERIEACAYATIPTSRLRVMHHLGPSEQPVADLWRDRVLPKESARRVIEDMYELGLLRTATHVRSGERTIAPEKEFEKMFHRVRRVCDRHRLLE